MTTDAHAAYLSARESCRRFLDGDHFHSYPHVQVLVPAGRAVDVAPLVPRPDESRPEWAARLASAGHEAVTLRIVEPWARDWAWWSWTRDQVEAVCRDRGPSLLPRRTELVLTQGRTHRHAVAPDEETLVWRLGDGVAEGPRRHGPGETVDLPDDCAGDGGGDPAGTWLTVTTGTDPRRLTAQVAATVAHEVTAATGLVPVPFTPVEGDGPVGHLDAMASAARTLLRRTAGHSDAMDLVRRTSSAGLEPVPPPRPAGDIPAVATAWRRTSTVVHLAAGDELLCGANGHGFTVPDARLAAALREVNTREVVHEADLVADGLSSGTARAVIRRLAQVRALEELA